MKRRDKFDQQTNWQTIWILKRSTRIENFKIKNFNIKWLSTDVKFDCVEMDVFTVAKQSENQTSIGLPTPNL